MAKFTKKDFLKEVRDEIEHIKEFATVEEKSKLNFESFDQISSSYCIYGQMTGDCNSTRAVALYPKKYEYSISRNDKAIGAVRDSKQVRQVKFSEHDFTYGNGSRYDFTPLEKYLFMSCTRNGNPSKQHKEIIDYIKGDINELKLR